MTATLTEKPVRRIDPDGMSARQLAGVACAVCRKRWPLPVITVGAWPDGRPAKVCPDCAQAVD